MIDVWRQQSCELPIIIVFAFITCLNIQLAYSICFSSYFVADKKLNGSNPCPPEVNGSFNYRLQRNQDLSHRYSKLFYLLTTQLELFISNDFWCLFFLHV